MSKDKMWLSKKSSRFIVPFSYAVTGKDCYEKLEQMSAGDNNKLWTPYDFSKTECDLYDFVKASLEPASGNAICHGYIVNSSCKKKILPNVAIRFGKEKDNPREIDVKIDNAGLYLFENGIGFLWYQTNAEDVSLLDLIELNNVIKEFSHNNVSNQCYQSVTKQMSTGIAVQNCYVASNNVPLPEDAVVFGKKKERYFLASQLPHSWDFEQSYEYYERQGEIWGKCDSRELFRFVDWVMELLEPVNVEDFFASREERMGDEKRNIPDKAVLFNIVLCVREEDGQKLQYEREGKYFQHLFHLSKGYSTKYQVPDDFGQSEQNRCFIPFKNSSWFASEEGCAQIIDVEEKGENRAFFQDTYWNRQEIYFYVYILVLQQYYGLLKINYRLSGLPKMLKDFGKAEARKQLKECREEINFFFTHSVYLKVSHISHQNQFYSYLREQYGLNEMTDKMKEKIIGMNDMVDAWYEGTRRRKTLAVSIVGSMFVFIQTLNNILGIHGYLPWKDSISVGEFTVVTFGIAVLISILAAFILNVFGDD